MSTQNQNQVPTQTSESAEPASAKAVAPGTPRRNGVTFTDSKANAFADRVLRWELLENRLGPVLDDMPYAKPMHAELVQLLADAKDLEFQLRSNQAAGRQLVANRRALVKNGDAIRARLGGAIVFEKGATSVLLNEFGLKPRRGGKGPINVPTTLPIRPVATKGAQE